jgi:hypothetical protein
MLELELEPDLELTGCPPRLGQAVLSIKTSRHADNQPTPIMIIDAWINMRVKPGWAPGLTMHGVLTRNP